MLDRSYQIERIAAAGSSRPSTGFVSSAGAGAAAASDRAWTMPSIVIPTTKRHLNPAPRPEEAVPR